MKNFVTVFCLLLFIDLNVNAQENIIWGWWNIGDKENSRVRKHNDGVFLFSGDLTSLNFRSDYYGNGPQISEQGYSYSIKKIILNEKDIVSLYIETELQNLSSHPIVNVKIILHFIDCDHMWMEIDRKDEKYPSDPRFSGYLFDKGSTVIFWREKIDGTAGGAK